MWQLVTALVEIALHRRGPEDLPPLRFLFGNVLAAYMLIGLLSLQIGNELPRAIQMMLVDTALFLSLPWFALRIFGHVSRYPQTAIALLGTTCLLGVLHIPLLIWNQSLAAAGETQPVLLLALALLLLLWSIDIGGYVLSKALGQSYVFGLLLMVVYVLGGMTLHDAVFPSSL